MNIHNTFFYVTKKIINIPQTMFGEWEKDTEKSVQQLIFNDFIISNNILIKQKYTFLNKYLNNPFITEEQKSKLFQNFNKIQRTSFALSKFAYVCKYKMSKIVVDYDLGLNPIDMSKNNSVCLLQNNNRYMFNVTDLINIITTALSNSPMFFSEPLISKNPFNNVPFNKSTLYNIYFYIRERTLINDQLIQLYFLANFDLDKFETDNEAIIRDYAIKKYVDTTITDSLYNSVLTMIQIFNYKNQNYYINIHPEFPKKQLVDIMRPYLLLYYTYNFSLTHIKKRDSKITFNKKLREFYMFNPNFGKKLIKVETTRTTNSNGYKNTYIYDDKYINFNEEDDTFLTSHLSNRKMIDEQNIVPFIFNLNLNNVAEEGVFYDDNDPPEDNISSGEDSLS
jgi:hypothetical protein